MMGLMNLIGNTRVCLDDKGPRANKTFVHIRFHSLKVAWQVFLSKGAENGI
jgi:hypothetical protein